MSDSLDWNSLRFQGDLQDLKELEDEYRIEDFIQANEESLQLLDFSLREKFLRDGVRLNQRLSPRIYQIYKDIGQTLSLEATAEVYCFNSHEINAIAFLDISKEGHKTFIGVTSQSLEILDDSELKFLIGHELGHFIFRNHRYNALYREDKDSSSRTVLPHLGDKLFLSWQKKTEISADRIGLLACRDLEKAAKALLKAHYGLSDKNLVLDVEALMQQLEEIKGKSELMKAEFASHPLLPIRLKALEYFSKSEKAQKYGFPFASEILPDIAMENQVEELLQITRRYPFTKQAEAVMKTVALGALAVLSVDREVNLEEIKITMEILSKYFTDEPEKETDPKDLGNKLKQAIEVANKECDHSDKTFILSRLSDVIMADGALIEVEKEAFLQIAKKLNVPERLAYEILLGAVHAGNLKVDTKLNKISEKIRNSLDSIFREPSGSH
jgi:hypothetical protein